MPLRTIGNFIPNAIQGIGRSDILLRNAISAAVIAPVSFLIGVRWGLLGLSAAWLVATPLIFVQNMVRSLPPLGLGFRQISRAMWPAAASGALMYAAVCGARLVLGAQGGIIHLVILIAVGASTYVSALFVLNRESLRDVYA